MDISLLRERNDMNIISVNELNTLIKNVLEGEPTLAHVCVRGEISNFVSHRSGHLYFSLKDESSQIRAVMFRYSAQYLPFMPENGMKVIVNGGVSLYSQGGTYQIYVNSMQPDGIGALYLAYEQLKMRLGAMGLFDSERKKALPFIPKRIGVITSPTGAAVRDIINVTRRRYPKADILLYPALVQGEGCPKSLIKALDYFETNKNVDVIIIGRGGGSIEDLWGFNNEELAYKLAEMSIPTISAVGHETDFTICDFVADMRAPTPSAAAELAVPDFRELIQRTDNLERRSQSAIGAILRQLSQRLEILKANQLYRYPNTIYEEMAFLFKEYTQRISLALQNATLKQRHALSLASEKINGLNPLNVLARGYAIAQKDERTVKSIDSVTIGDKLNVTLADGNIGCTVSKIERNS